MSNAAVVWTLVSIAGALVSAWALRDAIRSLFALEAFGNGRRIIARGYVRAEAIRLVIQLTWSVLGILRLSDSAAVPWTPTVIALVLTNFALLYKSADDLYVRYRVRHTPQHSAGRDETAIEKQDRIVGDERRAQQVAEDEQ